MDIGSFPHQVTRLVFDTGQPYEQFRARYEAAVPALDEKRLEVPVERCAREGGWSGSGTAAHAVDQVLRRQSVSGAEAIQDFGIHRVRE